MSDRLVRGLLPSKGLRAVHVRVTDTARMSRMLHGLYPTAARLFGEALAAGLLVAALQKDRSRVNLQITCDGPLVGLLVDADGDGDVRGYVRAPHVHFPGDPADGARAALGTAGTLSVLRDMGEGQYYRGQIALARRTIAGDLARYFAESEQIATALDLAVVPGAESEPLGDVAGVLVQLLPGGDEAALAAARARLEGGAFRDALARGLPPQAAIEAVSGERFELVADVEVAYRCGCSLERARNAVSALGLEGIRDVLANEKQAVVDCEFCRQRYVVTQADLEDMERRLVARGDGPARA